jgi:hypothetical protein
MTQAPNPYAPPVDEGPPSTSGGDTELEAIRRAHLSSETNIKTIGALALLGAVLQLLGAIEMMSVSAPRAFGGLIGCFLGGACGLGLRTLHSWGRTLYTVLLAIGVVLTGINLAMVPLVAAAVPVLIIFALVSALFLWVLWNAKARVVFSDHYREVVVRGTPHIKYKTSKIAIGVLVVLLLVFVAAIVAAVMG